MNFKNYEYIIPVVLIIVISFIGSIFLINYFKIDINDNTGLVKLQKMAIYEGIANKKNNVKSNQENIDIFMEGASE